MTAPQGLSTECTERVLDAEQRCWGARAFRDMLRLILALAHPAAHRKDPEIAA